mmetsp:Transcript_40908/g.131557  ORF Transcript_40908/g.131557 Transcript_40908/m.131557 type:complete len:216 (-) Transcript_40908:10-657(-)
MCAQRCENELFFRLVDDRPVCCHGVGRGLRESDTLLSVLLADPASAALNSASGVPRHGCCLQWYVYVADSLDGLCQQLERLALGVWILCLRVVVPCLCALLLVGAGVIEGEGLPHAGRACPRRERRRGGGTGQSQRGGLLAHRFFQGLRISHTKLVRQPERKPKRKPVRQSRGKPAEQPEGHGRRFGPGSGRLQAGDGGLIRRLPSCGAEICSIS